MYEYIIAYASAEVKRKKDVSSKGAKRLSKKEKPGNLTRKTKSTAKTGRFRSAAVFFVLLNINQRVSEGAEYTLAASS